MPIAVRDRSPSPRRPYKRQKTNVRPDVTHGIKPLGNALFGPPSIRARSLGLFALLPDEVILHVLSLLSASDLLAFSACSRASFAFARHEPLWKDLYVVRAHGILRGWAGSWRKTYICGSGKRSREDGLWPSDAISAKGLYSDVLYQPYLCASLDLERYFNGKHIRHNIPRNGICELSTGTFSYLYAGPSQPVIITEALSSWPAYSSSQTWSMRSLPTRFPDAIFQAEALSCILQEYMAYAVDCGEDDAPVYLFDSAFVESTQGQMGMEYSPPSVFNEDLFHFFGAERPNYRWLIIGPARSGSTFHKDPNGTSAWNAVVQGRKGWVMFPGDVLPPGVFVSDDEGEVTSPLSVAEWFESYFNDAWRVYGPTAKDPTYRGKMRVGICEEGEVLYVPCGWWHLVVNLEPSVAVTQNFVSEHELCNVLTFMRDKPAQISGFKPPSHLAVSQACADDDDEDVVDPYRAGLFRRFCDLLQENAPEVLAKALREMEDEGVALNADSGRKNDSKREVVSWSRMRGTDRSDEGDRGTTGFSFAFAFDDEESESL